MTICNICNDIPNIPIALSCSHLLCLLCVGISSECPLCEQDITDIETNIDNIKHRNYIWLYSSNFNHKWWCYSSKLNKIVENIYEDYILIKDMNKKFDEIDLGIKIKKNNSKKHKIDWKDYDELNVDDFDVADVQFEDDEIDNSPQDESSLSQKKSNVTSYVIKVCGNEYRIDFDTMKQINILDSSKSRRIKRVRLPENLVGSEYSTIINFLKNDLNIIGISGKKFE